MRDVISSYSRFQHRPFNSQTTALNEENNPGRCIQDEGFGYSPLHKSSIENDYSCLMLVRSIFEAYSRPSPGRRKEEDPASLAVLSRASPRRKDRFDFFIQVGDRAT